MPRIKLECSCGKVKGSTEEVNANSGTRIDCCCDDCQKFAHYLGQENSVLDQYGGTDIFQMPISHLKITEGNEHIACIRLSDKGLYRWYTQCCNTPIGNTMGAGVPFIGVVHNFMANASTRDEDLGKSRGHLVIKFARKEIPAKLLGSYPKVVLRIFSKLFVWKIRGLNKPSAFFDADGRAVATPKILS